MKKPFIAVVTPVYNGENTIEKSIQSLLKQTFVQWINIIVNDGSIDGTREVLDRYAADTRFIIINLEKNVGRGVARQIALDKTIELDAKYMCMLDADDMYYPDKLEWQFKYMELHPEITLMSCSIGLINNTGELKEVMEKFESETVLDFFDYRRYISVPHACSIIRTSDIGNVMFDSKMLLGEDQDFMIRLLKDKKYSYVPKIGYLYNREDSFSYEKYRKSLKLGLYSKRKLGLSKGDLIKISLSNRLKLIIVKILCLIRADIYFGGTNRKPIEMELENHTKLFIE